MATTTSDTSSSTKRRLPGDLTRAQELARMIRVDHAGEHGATRIYQGQLAVLGHKPVGRVIRHMAAQEEAHKATFDSLMAKHKVRPTVFSPIWSAAGFALGATTALMGERAAMACTVAVEEVIGEHYAAQVQRLEAAGEPDDQPLAETLSQFRDEELEHRDTGLAHHAEATVGYSLLSAAIKSGTRTAIWLAERF
jgi:ubiquinone biosynthesis monooxygenase Coq7